MSQEHRSSLPSSKSSCPSSRRAPCNEYSRQSSQVRTPLPLESYARLRQSFALPCLRTGTVVLMIGASLIGSSGAPNWGGGSNDCLDRPATGYFALCPNIDAPRPLPYVISCSYQNLSVNLMAVCCGAFYMIDGARHNSSASASYLSSLSSSPNSSDPLSSRTSPSLSGWQWDALFPGQLDILMGVVSRRRPRLPSFGMSLST